MGPTIVSLKGGRVLVWDVTCPDTFAPSHITLAKRETGAIADEAEWRKKQKYSSLMTTHHFVPIAIEMSGVFGSEAITLFLGAGPMAGRNSNWETPALSIFFFNTKSCCGNLTGKYGSCTWHPTSVTVCGCSDHPSPHCCVYVFLSYYEQMNKYCDIKKKKKKKKRKKSQIINRDVPLSSLPGHTYKFKKGFF